MFCSNCGNKLGENDRFCGKCGKNMDMPQEMGNTPQKAVEHVTDKKSKKGKPGNRGRIPGNTASALAIVCLALSIVFYVYQWIYSFNLPYVTVHGWWLVILSGAVRIALLFMVSMVIIKTTGLAYKRSVKVIWIAVFADGVWNLWILGCRALRVLDIISQDLADDSYSVYGQEEELLKVCLRIVFCVCILITYILVPYTVKKGKVLLSKILIGGWLVCAVWALGSFLGKEMNMLRFRDYEQYLNSLNTKLYQAAIYFFWIWFLLKVGHQKKGTISTEE